MNRPTSRQTRSAVLVAVALAATAACGSSGPSSGGTSAWSLTGGDELTFAASFEEWNAANPDNRIENTTFANDAYKQKVRTAIGAGEGPTLIYSWGGGVLASYVDAGQVVDLTAEVEATPELKARFLPSIADSGVVDGKIYAIPNNAMQPVVLFYNKEVLEQAGVEAPTTWDELMAAVPELLAAGVAPFALGGQSKWPNLMWEEYLVDRVGGPEVFDNIAAGTPDAWSDPAVIEANTMIQELVEAGGFVEGFSSIAADSGADLALLYTGKAAMLVQGTWNYPGLKTANPDFLADGKLGYVNFPAVSDGAGDPANVVGNPANFWSISSRASESEQAAALAYLKDGVMSPTYIDSLLSGGAVPPVGDIEDKLAQTDDPEFLSFVYALAKDAPNFQLSWDQALSPSQADALLSNLDKLFLLQITPEEFSANMNATLGT